MATVSVATWVELTNAINGAAEDTTVELTSDIDMNEELPTGVTTRVGGLQYKFIINGNGHKIKNIHSNSIRVFYGRSGTAYVMEINNVDFENVYLTNSAHFGTNVELHNCSLSVKLENSQIGDCTFYYCGLAVTGFGTSYLSYNRKAYFYFCNVELNGEFKHISGSYNDSYVKGNCTAGTTVVYGRLTIINATIGFTGDFNYDGMAQLILYNSDTIIVPSGSTISTKLIPRTTAELMSPNALRAKSFPMW